MKKQLSLVLVCLFLVTSVPALGGAPKYPVILAHGLFASDTLFSWRKVQLALWLRGYKTFVTEVSAIDSIETRGRQLARQVDRIRRRTGADKVNIIGHSMGGLDARYLITHLGYADRVASLTTLSTPHRGSSAADQILEDLGVNCGFTCLLIESIARLYNEESKSPDLPLALENLSTHFMANFNLETPDSPVVYYQSWSASATPGGRPQIRRLLREPYQVIRRAEGANDGLVSVESAKWGNYRGDLPSDHLGVIGLGRGGKHYRHKPWKFVRSVLEDLDSRGY